MQKIFFFKKVNTSKLFVCSDIKKYLIYYLFDFNINDHDFLIYLHIHFDFEIKEFDFIFLRINTKTFQNDEI